MCSYIRSFRDSFLDISERPPCEIHLGYYDTRRYQHASTIRVVLMRLALLGWESDARQTIVISRHVRLAGHAERPCVFMPDQSRPLFCAANAPKGYSLNEKSLRFCRRIPISQGEKNHENNNPQAHPGGTSAGRLRLNSGTGRRSRAAAVVLSRDTWLSSLTIAFW